MVHISKEERQSPQNINQKIWASLLAELLKTWFVIHEKKTEIIRNKIIPD